MKFKDFVINDKSEQNHEMCDIDLFNQKKKLGQNDSHICELIDRKQIKLSKYFLNTYNKYK